MRPGDGAILSLVGGFDFDRNKFNHVTQAQRQPGSSFKPFIYSAALEKGFTPATIVNDAPFYVPADSAGGEAWEPKNYDGKFDGPMRVRTALAKIEEPRHRARDAGDRRRSTRRTTSPASASTRSFTRRTCRRRWAPDRSRRCRWSPPTACSPTAATGSPLTSSPRSSTPAGNVISEAKPVVAGENAERAIDPRNAWIMTSLLKDVIAYGTATRAQSLGRKDLAGKTGTTNEIVDAWFCGYNAAMVGVGWIGFDQPKTMGNNETGAAAALPIWISYMAKVLKGTPEARLPMPEGIVAREGQCRVGSARRRRQPDRILLRRVPAPRPRRKPGPGRPARRGTSATSSSDDAGPVRRAPRRPGSPSRRARRAQRRPGRRTACPARSRPHRADRGPADRRARHHRLVAREAQGGTPADAARRDAAAVQRRHRAGARPTTTRCSAATPTRRACAASARRPSRGCNGSRAGIRCWSAAWPPGWATEHSDVRLELVADDPKAVEIALASAGVVYAASPPADDADRQHGLTQLRIVDPRRRDPPVDPHPAQRRNRPRKDDEPRLIRRSRSPRCWTARRSAPLARARRRRSARNR